MSTQIVGMAIQITEENAAKIAIVNGGIVPKVEHFYTGSVFIYPYDPDANPRIMVGYAFEANWKTIYHELNDQHFTEIVEI